MTTARRAQRSPRRHERGFTIIELIVAMTAALALSMAVFATAKQATRFFQQETRLANAQFAATVGFSRLRADIARAGFMSSPNVQRDRVVCPSPAGWPAALATLSTLGAIRITPADVAAASPRAPNTEELDLYGSYSSIEAFPVRIAEGNTIILSPNSTAVARSGGVDALSSIFMQDRVVRLVDDRGNHHYGIIQGFAQTSAGDITITLTAPLASRSSNPCGLQGYTRNALVNVINRIHYSVRSVATINAYRTTLLASTYAVPGDHLRTELVRQELTAGGADVPNTLDLVAEYAADLRFGLVVNDSLIPNDTTLRRLDIGDERVLQFASAVTPQTPVGVGPERIRAVRARLGVRSREADRTAVIGPERGVILRYPVPASSAAGSAVAFARTRTFMADISLQNLVPVSW